MSQLIKRQFATSASTKLWGYLFIPTAGTYDTLTLLAFGHGIGSAGYNEASAEAMLVQSPLELLKREGQDFVAVNPLTGKRNGIAVLCLQAPNGWLGNRETAYAIKNDLAEVKAINPNIGGPKSIHVAGLSAGGDFVMDFITDEQTLGMVISAVPMSPAGVGNTANYTKLVSNGIKVWCHTGNADGGYTQNAQSLVAGIKAAKGDARLTLWNGGHGDWVNQVMVSTKKWNTWTGTMLINMLEFMVLAETPNWVPSAEPSSDFTAVLTLPGATLQQDGTYLVTKPNQVISAVLSSNVVTGASDSFVWGVQTIVPGTYGAIWADGGGMWGPAIRALRSDLPANGTYQITVTVKSLKDPKKTLTAAATVVVKIGATVPEEPKPIDWLPHRAVTIDIQNKRVRAKNNNLYDTDKIEIDVVTGRLIAGYTAKEGTETQAITYEWNFG